MRDIEKAMEKLRLSALSTQKHASKDGTAPYYLRTKKLASSKLDKIEREHRCKFPKVYRWFVERYGLLQFTWGDEKKGIAAQGVQHMFEPEPLDLMLMDSHDNDAIDRCLAIQYDLDDSVENFVCFVKDAKTASRELPIAVYYHDEPFELSGSFKKARTFGRHILAVIAHHQEACDDFCQRPQK